MLFCVLVKDLENAIHWIAKAFKLARGELWLGGADHCKLTMHELLAPIYANLLLRQARLKISDDFEFSFGLAKEAILILCEGLSLILIVVLPLY